MSHVNVQDRRFVTVPKELDVLVHISVVSIEIVEKCFLL
jgi:hypothetical protein